LSVSTTCFSSFFVLPYTQFQIYWEKNKVPFKAQVTIS
jgi:hypothetical protein